LVVILDTCQSAILLDILFSGLDDRVVLIKMMLIDLLLPYIIDIWLMLIVIAVHELGHYIGYRAAGFHPTLKFKNGLILIGENVINDVKLSKMKFISFLGIWFGVGFIWFYSLPDYFYIVYALMCSVDIVTILNSIEMNKKYGDVTVREATEKEAYKILFDRYKV